ncbi:hypothetical protein NLU13_2395 [Sarocladium strictum]|uniref:Peptidase S33 tripeptidyl aminopeptidase-like C-terminal domain-containing protein n=1 Tax=Sarocladium strictum TaxID=5046 RepID=A0AA39GT01_SARSR|nr:hypothetical protein NLU13_2395 [Sarocladium strictum]
MVKSRSVLVALAALGAVAAKPQHADFDWNSLTPSASLNYSSCYGDFKCARLLVPLDWLDESNPERVTLAITALPAVVPEDDPTFGGTIFTNPGGPSGSGVDFLLSRGHGLRKMADSEDKKFEFLSFDPRGVGETLPRADCWQDEFARQGFNSEEAAMGAPDEGPHVVGRNFARARGFGTVCERSTNGSKDDIRNFISTSSVARDMVAMVDKIDELRNPKRTVDGEIDDAQLELRSDKDLPRLNYIGFSYGTVLGNYFASMFPGRVGHVALEAVVDVHDYFNGTWTRNLQDMPHTYEHFWETCFVAGAKCALHKAEDTGPDDISARFEAWLKELDASPATYMTETSIHPITPYSVALAMFRPMYAPMRLFPATAHILAEAMAGNYTGVHEAVPIPALRDACPLRDPQSYSWSRDAMAAIACGDALPQTHVTIPQFQDYIGELKSQDPRIGPYWSSIRIACTGWRYRPSYSFSGPWTTPAHDPSGVPGKPLAPLLFVSSQYDPVTPLRNAREMMKYHPGSGLLIQDNVGHGSIGTPGKCRDEAIKRFFARGEVPDGELFCEADCIPFQDCPDADALTLQSVDEGVMSRQRSPLEMPW